MKNREIKFRSWNGLAMEASVNVMAGAIGAFYVQGMDETDSASLSTFNTKYPDSVAVMQFTGLKDKNGKEIYEGDILKDNELIGKVVYASPSFIVETSTQIYALAKGLVMQTELKDSEVIGNVYENPELLQEVTA